MRYSSRRVVDERLRRTALLAEKTGKKRGSRFWLAVAEELRRPRRQRAEVNLNQVTRVTSPGETVVVAGKLLGYGSLGHSLRMSSFSASSSAMRRISESGGEYLPLEKLISDNPEGRGLKLIR